MKINSHAQGESNEYTFPNINTSRGETCVARRKILIALNWKYTSAKCWGRCPHRLPLD